MKLKIFLLITLIAGTVFSVARDKPAFLGDLSFKDAVWDVNGNMYFTRRSISEITDSGDAAVIYFFTVGIC